MAQLPSRILKARIDEHSIAGEIHLMHLLPARQQRADSREVRLELGSSRRMAQAAKT